MLRRGSHRATIITDAVDAPAPRQQETGWLEQWKRRRVAAATVVDSGSTPVAIESIDIGPALTGPDLDADTIISIEQQIAIDRAEVAADFANRLQLCTDFKVLPRSGAGTFIKTGSASDTTRAECKSGPVRHFCSEYHLQHSTGYSWFKFDKQHIAALASFWCNRMQHFYDIFLSSGPGHIFTTAEIDGYEEPAEIVELSTTGPDHVVQRINQIRKMRPRR